MVNPYGYCDCDGQIFIADNCHEGFICQSDPPEQPDGDYVNGCRRRCGDDEVMQPNFAAGTIECVPDTNQ